ncbi:MAG: hypothetical protein U0Q18_33930 [Bryobacteraceae bacterium]
MLKNAFLSSSGSKVHSIKSMPSNGVFALLQLQHAADAAVAITVEYAEHVAVEVRFPAGFPVRG